MGKLRHVLRHVDASNATDLVESLQDAADRAAAASGRSQATMMLDVLIADVRRHFACEEPGPYLIDLTFNELPNGDWHLEGTFGALGVEQQGIQR